MQVRAVISFFILIFTLPVYANTYISTGLYYLNGQTNLTDQTPVESWSTPISLTTYQQAWQFSLSTSWSSITTQDNATQQSVQGMGDTYLRVGHTWMQETYLTAALIYKLATGNVADGLSSGKNDLGLQVELFQPIKQHSSVFGHLGYRFNGKVTSYDIQNTVSASIGLGHQLKPNWSAAVSTSYQQSQYPSLNNQTSLEAMLDWQFSNLTSLGFFSSYDNTQTMSLGLSISRQL